MKNPTIMGTVAGDTIGSVFEFNPTKDYNFRLFYDDSIYTDDSIMTVAVAEWLMESKTLDADSLVAYMQKWGRKYPDPYGAYGGMFSQWLRQERPQPYGSWGNGAAMRVGAVGFWCSSLEETMRIAEITASVSHNHPEGVKGAQAVAASVCGNYDVLSGDEYIIQIIDSPLAPLSISEMQAINEFCSELRPDVDVVWGTSRNETGRDVGVKIAARNLKITQPWQ